MDVDDRADECFNKMLDACQGFSAADVVFALGMMIARAIEYNAVDKNPERTMQALRGIVDLELGRK